MKILYSGLLAAGMAFAATFPAAAQENGLAAIKEAGELKIAMSAQYPPFNFVNEQNPRSSRSSTTSRWGRSS